MVVAQEGEARQENQEMVGALTAAGLHTSMQ